MASPTSRTTRILRAAGYMTSIVEHWNPHARIRQDLFGFGDILAVKKGEILLLQVTTGSNGAKRVKKIFESKTIVPVLESGMHVQVWAWRKLKKGGWLPKITEITLDDATQYAREYLD